MWRPARSRHRYTEAVRADQAHASAPGGLEQARFLGRRKARGNDHQRSGSAFPALLGHVQDARRWYRHHHEVGGLGQRGDRRDARDALDVAGVRVNGVQGTGETGVSDVEQNAPANRSGLADLADHHGRPGSQQRLQACRIGMFVPAGHRVQIGAVFAEGRALRHRHGQLNHAVARPAPHAQTRVAKHLQHGAVPRQHLSGQDPHAAGPGQRDSVLEQQRGDTTPVHTIGDRQRHLSGPLAGDGLIAGDPGQLIAQQAKQRPVVRAGLAAHPAGFLLRSRPVHAEETEVEVVRRHCLVQPLDKPVISGARRPDGHDGSVGQERMRQPGLRERRNTRLVHDRSPRVDGAAPPDVFPALFAARPKVSRTFGYPCQRRVNVDPSITIIISDAAVPTARSGHWASGSTRSGRWASGSTRRRL